MNSRSNFVGHNIFEFGELTLNHSIPINNVIFITEHQKIKWIEETTRKIGEWRAIFRSTYISWAVTINGLHIAHSKYSDPNWIKNNKFSISSVRKIDEKVGIIPIAMWESSKVADAHLKPLSMLCSYGLIDLYSNLEEFIFDLFKIYWWGNPEQLMKGNDFKELRQIYRNKETSKDKWEAAFSERLENWQKKKLYDGLGKVFRSYCQHTKISTPSFYTETNLETWAKSIDGFALLRNCLTHGVKITPPELAEFSKMPYRIGFNFQEGKDILVNLDHLMNVEGFCDSLLTGINISLFEQGNVINS